MDDTNDDSDTESINIEDYVPKLSNFEVRPFLETFLCLGVAIAILYGFYLQVKIDKPPNLGEDLNAQIPKNRSKMCLNISGINVLFLALRHIYSSLPLLWNPIVLLWDLWDGKVESHDSAYDQYLHAQSRQTLREMNEVHREVKDTGSLISEAIAKLIAMQKTQILLKYLITGRTSSKDERNLAELEELYRDFGETPFPDECLIGFEELEKTLNRMGMEPNNLTIWERIDQVEKIMEDAFGTLPCEGI